MVDEGAGSSALTPRQRRALTRVPSDGVRIAVLASAGLVAAFMQTIVTPIIPHLPEYLDTTTADAQWVLTATLLSAAIATPISGRLGDMFGKRRILLWLLGCLLVGAVVSALSNTLIPMLVGRVLQGIGIGVIALGISILRDIIHPRNLGSAIAIVSATLGVGGALGLPLAAVVAQQLDWHWLFWLAALLAVAVGAAVLAVIPVSTLRAGGRFDVGGAVGLAAGLTGVLLAVSKGAEWGWGSPLTIGVLAGSVVVLAGWAVFEWRVRDPLVDLRVASRRPVLFTNLASVAIGYSFFVLTGSLPVLLETRADSGVGFGLTLLLASLCLMPLGVVMFAVSPLAARFSDARGPKASLVLGSVVILVAFLVAIVLLDELWHVLLLSTLVGIGTGFAYAAMPNLIMRSVPPWETAAANGLNSVMRTLGSTVSAAVAGVILSTQTFAFAGAQLPTRAAYAWVFGVAAIVVAAGVVCALLVPRRSVGLETASIPVQDV